MREKRIERNLTLRNFSSLIKKAPSTISGIENGDKVAPSDEVLKSICTVLQLNPEEEKKLYDLATITKTNNKIPADITETIKKSSTVRIALRVAKDLDATDEEWEDFMRRLQEKRDTGGAVNMKEYKPQAMESIAQRELMMFNPALVSGDPRVGMAILFWTFFQRRDFLN